LVLAKLHHGLSWESGKEISKVWLSVWSIDKYLHRGRKQLGGLNIPSNRRPGFEREAKEGRGSEYVNLTENLLT
jgi:hypothetical protein